MGIKDPLVRYLAYSQIAFYASVLICTILAPAGLRDNDGLSYFGVHKITIIPYGAGLLISAYLVLKSLNYLSEAKKLIPLRWSMKSVAWLMAGIVVTPYSIDNWFDWIHTTIGTTLFSIQLLLVIWLILTIKNDWINWLLLVVQVTGGLISLFYLAPPQGFLLQGQVLFQAAFSVILLRSLSVISVSNSHRGSA